MRSTRATSAIERLKERTGHRLYTMARTGDELFFLTEGPGLPPLCPPLELDAFVAFVNGLGALSQRPLSDGAHGAQQVLGGGGLDNVVGQVGGVHGGS